MNLLIFHQRFLKAFQKADVQYLMVGGYAVNIYGYIRATVDLDIWIHNDPVNLRKMVDAFVSMVTIKPIPLKP